MKLVGTKEHPLEAWTSDGKHADNEHVCEDAPEAVIREWLDRQRLLGLITPEGAAAVERLIEDLR